MEKKIVREGRMELVYLESFWRKLGSQGDWGQSTPNFCKAARENAEKSDERGFFKDRYNEYMIARVGYVSLDFYNSQKLQIIDDLQNQYDIFGDFEHEDMRPIVKRNMTEFTLEEFLRLGKQLTLHQEKIYTGEKSK